MKKSTPQRKRKITKAKAAAPKKMKRSVKASRSVVVPKKKKASVQKAAIGMKKRPTVIQKIAPQKTSVKKVTQKQTTEDKTIEEILKRVEAINAARLISFRGNEITRPMKIERMLPVEPESKWDFENESEPAQENRIEETVTVSETRTEDTKSAQDTTQEQESETVMIRSVSQFQTPRKHSSEDFVEQETKSNFTFARAFSMVSIFVLAVIVVSAGVFKLGATTGRVVSQQQGTPQVAGAETGEQTYTFKNQFLFLYPTNWIVIEKGNALELRDSQGTDRTVKPSIVTITSVDLAGKSFQQWFSTQKQYKGTTALRVNSQDTLSYQLINKDGTPSTSVAFLINTSRVVIVNLKQESSVAARTVFSEVVNSLRFL
jgi:hypothetical protein